MILALKYLNKIQIYLDARIKKSIQDYRISFKSSTDIDIFVRLVEGANTEDFESEFYEKFPQKRVALECVSEEDYHSDAFYKQFFESPEHEKKVMHMRRRYDNVFRSAKGSIPSKREHAPVISFYSYKGGVGRTTTLFMFALWYANVHKKTVVAIDCDFEAPGLVNFLGAGEQDGEQPSLKNGAVEYLLDNQFLGAEPNDLQDYLYELPRQKYSDNGKIYLMPAGNLSTERTTNGSVPALAELTQNNYDSYNYHFRHYLEALSRLNISNQAQIVDRFNALLKRIAKEINPDVILIDSRTGFNDVFANLALSLSSIVIGFFSCNIQTRPGLNFFLETLSSNSSETSNISEICSDIILVNSITSNPDADQQFMDYIESIVGENPKLTSDITVNIPVHSLNRESDLETLGAHKASIERLIKNIHGSYYGSHKDLFGEIVQKLEDLESNEDPSWGGPEACNNTASESSELPRDSSKTTVVENLNSGNKHNKLPLDSDLALGLRNAILDTLRKSLPKAHSEYIALNDDTLKNTFFYRKCMEDVFNKSLFLLIGGKGTGKTFFYRMLSNDHVFLESLQRKAQKPGRYFIVPAIQLKDSDQDGPSGFFSITGNVAIDELKEVDFDWYFKRFWTIYTYVSIILNYPKLNHLGMQAVTSAHLPDEWQCSDSTKAAWIDKKIKSDSEFTALENELLELDRCLNVNGITLMILYDQLDHMAKPKHWSKCIAPLINFWRSNPFANIHPKIFLRNDLFAKLGNITNKASLKQSQCITLEWDEKELFGVLFKYILSRSKQEFFELMRVYQDFSQTEIDDLRAAIDADNQIPLDKKILEPLVVTFFGDTVKTGNVNISSYSWFYRNLCNADRTISLRPFLGLITHSIENYFQHIDEAKNRYIKPILDQRHYTFYRVRANAVEQHVTDMASEEGNGDIKRIFNYIQRHAPPGLRKSFLTKNDFETLISSAVEITDDMEHRSFDDLVDLLKANGIISIKHAPGGYDSYVFAFLYKYYLGLSSR